MGRVMKSLVFSMIPSSIRSYSFLSFFASTVSRVCTMMEATFFIPSLRTHSYQFTEPNVRSKHKVSYEGEKAPDGRLPFAEHLPYGLGGRT